MSKYPEHERLQAIATESQAIGHFLDFGLPAQGLVVCETRGDSPRLWPTSKSITQILADYFEIDQNKIDEEKQDMLDEIRKANRG